MSRPSSTSNHSSNGSSARRINANLNSNGKNINDNGKNSKPASRARRLRSRAARNSPDRNLFLVAKQLTDPASIEGIPVACPTKGGAQTCSRRYRRVVEYKPATTSFTVVMGPDLEAPGFISGLAAKVLPAGAPDFLQAKPHGKSSETARGGAYYATHYDQELIGIFKTQSDHMIAEVEDITDGGGVTLRGYAVAASGGHTVSITNDDLSPHRIYVHTKTAGVWAVWVSATLASHETQQWTTTAGVIEAIALTNSGAGCRVHATFAFFAGQITSAAVSHYAPAFDKQVAALGIYSGRVLSMAMKVTNMSEKLKRQGAVCSGRVPYNFHAFRNISSELSKLPRNRRYHGTAADGTRVGWIPEQADEWEFDQVSRKLDVYRESNYLITHFSGLDADTSFLLTFDWYVDFALQSQNFPLTTSPAWTDEFEQLVHLMALADAATCNPLSVDVFRNLLRSVKPYVESGEAHYRRHKPLYDYLMRQALTLVV